jgi:hypothetical protein
VWRSQPPGKLARDGERNTATNTTQLSFMIRISVWAN